MKKERRNMGFKKRYKEPKELWLDVNENDVLETISRYYFSPELLVEEMKTKPGMVVSTPFSLFTYQDGELCPEDKEILDRIYDTLFENVGMSEYHVKFLTDEITDQEVWQDIRFTINDVRYKLKLERILDE